MRVAALLCLTALAACAGPYFNEGSARDVSLAPGDLVVVGQLENLDYQPVNGPDDILGHGFMTAILHIHSIEQGDLDASQVPVVYFGHTYFREDARFRFRLRPKSSGGYSICANPGSQGIICD